MSTEEAVVALFAILAGSLLKSISGVGLPLVAVPAISYVAGIETAVAVTAIPNLAINGAMARRERGSASETRDLPVLGVAGFLGAIAGTVLLVSLPEEGLILLLVAVVVAYAVTFFTNPEFRIAPARARRLAPAVGGSAGLMQGAVGISGPIVASWIHAYRLPRGAHIFSVTTLFALAGVAQVPALVVSGEMDGLWIVALIGCVPALATVPIGARLRNALSAENFDRFVVVTLLVSVIGLAIRTFV
ncbi:MAG: sulfite exporter TauE/SafE family protein [Actinomycetota bacterium]